MKQPRYFATWSGMSKEMRNLSYILPKSNTIKITSKNLQPLISNNI